MRLIFAGFILGVIGAAAAAALVPPVNHEYTASITSVSADGRAEAFHIRLPDDRLLDTGAPGSRAATVPPGRRITADRLGGLRAELFQIRDARDAVIGLAGHIEDSASGGDWVVYIPGRGSLFMSQREVVVTAEGERVIAGRIVGGTETLSGQVGSYTVRTIERTDGPRIHIDTLLRAAEL